jgi:4-hydroxybenzoate polyprenyltransferase
MRALAWITGAAVMLGGAMPDARILLLALLYGLGAHGIMTLNDFKAIEGDRQLGVRSLPVQLGVQNAAWVACAVMLLPQFVVVWLLFEWVQPVHAAAVASLVMVQAVLMVRFLENPVARATWLSALGVTVYVSGMMISAFAVRAAIAGTRRSRRCRGLGAPAAGGRALCCPDDRNRSTCRRCATVEQAEDPGDSLSFSGESAMTNCRYL